MSNLGQRIRDERAQLGLTQDAFAKGCGVGRRAQAAYEAGERVPDANYLAGAAALGADTQNILTGYRRDADSLHDYVREALLRAVCEELGIPSDAVNTAFDEARSKTQGSQLMRGASYAFTQIAQGLLRESKRLRSVEVVAIIDRDVLTDIIRELESALRREGGSPPAYAKALVISRLYEKASMEGRIDQEAMMPEAKNLTRSYR